MQWLKNHRLLAHLEHTDFVKEHIIEELQDAPTVKEVPVEEVEVSELVEVVQPMIDLFAQGE